MPALQEIGTKDRGQGQGHDKGDKQGDRDGVGQGRKELALNPFKGHQREEHEANDADTKEDRRPDFAG